MADRSVRSEPWRLVSSERTSEPTAFSRTELDRWSGLKLFDGRICFAMSKTCIAYFFEVSPHQPQW